MIQARQRIMDAAIGLSGDGRTYYGTAALGPGLTAVDIADPSQPKELLHHRHHHPRPAKGH